MSVAQRAPVRLSADAILPRGWRLGAGRHGPMAGRCLRGGHDPDRLLRRRLACARDDLRLRRRGRRGFLADRSLTGPAACRWRASRSPPSPPYGQRAGSPCSPRRRSAARRRRPSTSGSSPSSRRWWRVRRSPEDLGEVSAEIGEALALRNRVLVVEGEEREAESGEHIERDVGLEPRRLHVGSEQRERPTARRAMLEAVAPVPIGEVLTAPLSRSRRPRQAGLSLCRWWR